MSTDSRPTLLPARPARWSPSPIVTLLVVAVLLVAGCGDDAQNTPTDSVSSDTASDVVAPSDVQEDGTSSDATPGDGSDAVGVTCARTLAVGVALEATLTRRAATLGTWPNAIAVDGGFAYVVNSGDNTVQRFALADPTGTSTPAFVDVGADKGPYDLAIFGDRLYITNNVEGSITVADTSGQVLGTTVVDALDGPQAIVATADYLLVANSEYSQSGTADPFGSLVVLTRSDTPTLVTRVATTQSNPQFVLVGGTGGNDVFVINSGATDYNFDTGVVTPLSAGGVDFFALDTLASATAPTANVELAPAGLVGNPGRPALVGDALFLGSGTASVLFVVDVLSKSLLRGANDPLWLGESSAFNGFAAPFAGPHGALYVLDLNNDVLRVVDVDCQEVVGEPVALAESTELLEGPLTLAWTPEGAAAILMTVSATITTFDAATAVQ